MSAVKKIQYQTAVQPRIQNRPLTQPKIQSTPVKSVATKPQIVRKPTVFTVIIAILLLSASLFIVTRHSEISRNHTYIMSLQDTLESETNRAELLNIELTSRIDLRRIEAIASAELQMRHPRSNQVMNVTLTSSPDLGENKSSETTTLDYENDIDITEILAQTNP